MAAKLKRNKRYQDILDHSMALFNESGVESVSVFRVAESLKISPGNLTYHFKKKADLVRALLDALEAEVLQALKDFPYTSGAREYVQGFGVIFNRCWKYRGLFNSGPYLVQSGLVKSSRFRALNSHIIGTLVAQSKRLTTQGFMHRVPPPYSIETLIDCIWWQWLGWLRVNQLLEPGERIAVDRLIASGISHTLFLVSPYLRSNFANDAVAALKELYPESESSRHGRRLTTSRA